MVARCCVTSRRLACITHCVDPFVGASTSIFIVAERRVIIPNSSQNLVKSEMIETINSQALGVPLYAHMHARTSLRASYISTLQSRLMILARAHGQMPRSPIKESVRRVYDTVARFNKRGAKRPGKIFEAVVDGLHSLEILRENKRDSAKINKTAPIHLSLKLLDQMFLKNTQKNK